MVALAPTAPVAAPRAPGFGRAFGRQTVLSYRSGGTSPLVGATVWAYAPGTTTPWPDPLYADESDAVPVVFPVATDDAGAVALWSDAPARLELVCSSPGYVAQRVPLDLEPPPDAPGLDAYTKTESDLRYLPIGYVPPPAEVTVTTDGSLSSTESPANTFALAARLSPDAANALALRGNGLYVPTAAVVTTGEYTFSANATMADPGSGNFRSNTGSSATATALALDQLGAGGADVSTLFSALRLGDTVYVQDKNDATRWARYQMTGAPTLNSGWAQLPVVVITAGAAIGGGQLCVMQMTMTAGGGGGGIGLATDALADAKGDVFAAAANNAVGRLALGTDGQVLTADSAQALGVKWAAAVGGGAFVDEAGDVMTGALVLHGAAATANVLQAKLAADAFARFQADAAGKLEWGSGAGAPTVGLARSFAGGLGLTGDLLPVASGTASLGTTSQRWQTVGTVSLDASTSILGNADTTYLRLGATNPAASGAVRLRNAAGIAWRNAAGGADLTLTVSAGDQLTFNGAPVGNLDQATADARYLQLAAGGAVTGTITYKGAALPKITVQSTAPSSPTTGDLWIW